MKLSYIIMPSESVEYLIRCINSLYRQTSSEFEVILAENDFGEEEDKIENYLKEHKEVKRITKNAVTRIEKIIEALEIMEEDIAYMTFLTMNTVVVPIITELVLKEAQNTDVFACNVVLKQNANSTILKIIRDVTYGEISALGFDRLFYGKQAIQYFKMITQEEQIETELISMEAFLSRWTIQESEIIGFYTDENLNKEETKNNVLASNKFIETLKILYESETETWVAKTLEYYLIRYQKCLFDHSVSNEIKENAYNNLKKIASWVQNREVLEKLFELYLGCSICEMEGIDYSMYVFLKERDFLKKNTEFSEKTTMNFNQLILKDESDKIQKTLDEVVGNMNELQLNMHQLMKNTTGGNIQRSLNYINPIEEIPEMFAQGKLGFKVILQSIKAWFTYKIKRK